MNTMFCSDPWEPSKHDNILRFDPNKDMLLLDNSIYGKASVFNGMEIGINALELLY